MLASTCAQDRSFGPASTCRPFDFTWSFENAILSIVPDAVWSGIVVYSLACLALYRDLGFSVTAAPDPAPRSPRLLLRTWWNGSRPGQRRDCHGMLKNGLAATITVSALVLLIADRTSSGTIESSVPARTAALVLNLVVSAFGLLPLVGLAHGLLPGPSTRLVAYLVVKVIFAAVLLRTSALINDAEHDLRLSIAFQSIAAAAYAALLVLECCKKPIALPSDGSEEVNPEQNRGLLSRSSMFWHFPLVMFGLKNRLPYERLYAVPPATKAGLAGPRLYRTFFSRDDVRCGDKTRKAKGYRLIAASFRAFWPFWIAPVLPRLVVLAAQMMQPIIFEQLIRFSSLSTESKKGDIPPPPSSHGWALAASVSIIYAIVTLGMASYWESNYKARLNLRAALISVVYAKLTRLQVPLPDADPASTDGDGVSADAASTDKATDSSEPKSKDAVAASADATVDASTLISVDVEKVASALEISHEFWAAIISIGVAAYLLYVRIGLAFLACLGAIIIFAMVSTVIARLIPTRQRVWLEKTQARVVASRGAIESFAPIQYNSRGPYFAERLTDLRDQELTALAGFYRPIAWVASVSNMAVNLTALLGFATAWALSGHSGITLDISTVFSAFTTMQLLDMPIGVIGQYTSMIFAALAGFARIEAFLCKPENTVLATNGSTGDSKVDIPLATFNGQRDMMLGALRTSGLGPADGSVPRLIVITGSTGGGKTTFVRRFVERLRMLAVEVGYSAQDPWIKSGTVRDNIVFHQPYDPERLERVIDICALRTDLELMKDGDMTLLGAGSSAITLSGGQQHRVSIARALYSDAPLLVLDDSLAALDAHTAEAIRRKLVFNEDNDPILSGRNIMWVSSLIKSVRSDDHVALIDKFKVAATGSLAELKSSGALPMDLLKPTPGSEDEFEPSDAGEKLEEVPASADEAALVPVLGKAAAPGASLDRPADADSKISASLEDPEARDLDEDKPADKNDDDDFTRGMSIKVYSFYFSKTNKGLLYFALMCGLVGFLSVYAVQIILERWTSANLRDSPFYLGMLALAAGAGLVGLTTCYILFFTKTVVQAGKGYHDSAIAGLMRSSTWSVAGMSDSKLVTRFAQDVAVCDSEFSLALINTIATLILLIGSIALIFASAPYLTASAPFLLAAYWGLQRLYLRTSRQVRRLDLEATSTLFAAFEETRRGLETIRALGKTAHFETACQAKLDRAQKPTYVRFTMLRLLRNSLNAMTWVIATGLALVAVAVRGTTSAGLLGVALTNVTTLSFTLNAVLQSWVMLETAAVAVERIQDVANLEPDREVGEEDRSTPRRIEAVPDVDAPPKKATQLSFNAFSLRYSEKKPWIVRDVTIDVPAGTKLGLCGRSGSGKSSLLTGLVRGVRGDLTSGSIVVDGSDSFHEWDIESLRRQLSLVTQDPSVWKASIRELLVPEPTARRDKVSDAELWSALSDVGLDKLVSQTKLKLDTVLSPDADEAENDETLALSKGQKQLLCMARAVVQRHSFGLLLLDEATSSLDDESERILIDVVRRRFQDHTVIAVAHRIKTILDFDNIVVMDAGVVVEQGPPALLLVKRNESRFRKLAEGQGLALSLC